MKLTDVKPFDYNFKGTFAHPRPSLFVVTETKAEL